MAQAINAPTPVTARSLQNAYDYWNKKLFNKSLPRDRVLIVWSHDPKLKEGGQFTPAKWADDGGDIAEIAISARKSMEVEELQACLIHQMVHYEQALAGLLPTQKNYHNSGMLKRLNGLGINALDRDGNPATPSAVIYNSVRPGGLIDLCMQDLPDDCIPEIDCNLDTAPATNTSGKRQKYVCPICKAAVWGKFGLSLHCNDCDCDYEPVDSKKN